MKLTPDYQLCVLTEETFDTHMPQITARLAQCRQEGTFAGFDGKELYYEYYQTAQSRGAVVIVHGLSEFTAKYHEFAWYLLNQGYDVFLYDQRCHGKSCRLMPQQDLIHVEHFADYIEDLHCFVNRVVRQATDLPLYLYGHSMGGATAAFYIAQHPEVFRKAVLSAPMIQPQTGSIAPFVARLGLGAACMFGKGKQKFWQAKEFNPNYTFEGSQDKSYARFLRNKNLRLSNVCYQTAPQTTRWTQQSMALRRRLTSKALLKKIPIPVLMISGEKDTVVCPQAQAEFVKNCPVCQQVILQDATHNMLWGTEKIVTAAVQRVLDHFA